MYGRFFLKLCIGIGLTISGALRLIYPEIGEKEMKSATFLTKTDQKIIAIYELIGLPVLMLYCLSIFVITIVYLRDHKLEDLKMLVPFTNDSKVILYHFFIVLMMISIMI
jgi:hypothetical protein